MVGSELLGMRMRLLKSLPQSARHTNTIDPRMPFRRMSIASIDRGVRQSELHAGPKQNHARQHHT